MTLSLNRIVALLTALSGLLAAIVVPLANLDTSSTIGVAVGLGTVVAAAVKWLDGWQKHEARESTDVDPTPAVKLTSAEQAVAAASLDRLVKDVQAAPYLVEDPPEDAA
jgi:hypothetical protein